jgi:hypothetical protein
MRSLTIRLAGPGDAGALHRLAALDSAPVPDGTVLLGLVDGEPWAALALDSGAAVADPFERSGEVVTLLRERARLLGYEPSRSALSRRWRRRTLIAGPSVSASSSH